MKNLVSPAKAAAVINEYGSGVCVVAFEGGCRANTTICPNILYAMEIALTQLKAGRNVVLISKEDEAKLTREFKNSDHKNSFAYSIYVQYSIESKRLLR
jgi:hypothetical protein